jgi:hypothetical protein
MRAPVEHFLKGKRSAKLKSLVSFWTNTNIGQNDTPAKGM